MSRQWLYHVQRLPQLDSPALDVLGLDGWELITVLTFGDCRDWIFKRPFPHVEIPEDRLLRVLKEEKAIKDKNGYS